MQVTCCVLCCRALIQKQGPSVDSRSTLPGWQVLLSITGVLRNRHLGALSHPTRRMLQDKQTPIPESLLLDPERPRMEWTLPGFISLFLPEFPHRSLAGQVNLQVTSNSPTLLYFKHCLASYIQVHFQLFVWSSHNIHLSKGYVETLIPGY